ncbi:MAG: alpha/beta hydrolase [Verrucomicrobiota bacterium]
MESSSAEKKRPASMVRNEELVSDAEKIIYKEPGNAELTAYLFYPPEEVTTASALPVVAFFPGGLWDGLMVSQFVPHCLHLAGRGALSVIFEYREMGPHQATPLDAVADAKSAIRWLRMNDDSLRLNPDMIIGCGASGGGHAILSAGLVEGYDEPGEPTSISSQPNAVVLFSAVVDTTKKGVGLEHFPDPNLAKITSPSQHVRPGLPPTLLFHGGRDPLVPFAPVQRFVKQMKRKKNQCFLEDYEGEGHSFFNFNVNMQYFESTLSRMDSFLVDLGVLPERQIDNPLDSWS